MTLPTRATAPPCVEYVHPTQTSMPRVSNNLLRVPRVRRRCASYSAADEEKSLGHTASTSPLCLQKRGQLPLSVVLSVWHVCVNCVRVCARAPFPLADIITR